MGNDKKERIKNMKEKMEWFNKTDLKQLRKDRGFKLQKDLAKAVGYCNSVISEFESKKKKSIITISKMYDFFNPPKVNTKEDTKESLTKVELKNIFFKVIIANQENQINEYKKELNRYIKIIDKLIE